jgi:hypothetical protein
MFVLSRLAAIEPRAWPSAARFVRGRGAVAGIVAMALAAAAASPAWPEGPQQPAHPAKKAAAAPDLNADGSVPDSIAKAGAQTRVAAVRDCLLPNQAPPVFARADHGAVSVKQETGPGCGRPSASQTNVFYTSAPGFKGTDKLYVLGYLNFSNISQTYTILVK